MCDKAPRAGARVYNGVMVVVRPQLPGDIDEVAAVQVRAWRAAYAGRLPADALAALDPAEVAAVRRGYLEQPEVHTVVADDAQAIVGFASYGPYQGIDQSDDADREVGQLYAMYVEPARWGGGVGRSLLATVRADLAGSGRAQLRLWVLESNAQARRFYERHGLRPDGERSTIEITRPGGEVAEFPVVRHAGATIDESGAPPPASGP
ncbi:MAG TPA: GNAT family N-acetyltransferase [Actinoplanes sp.]|nr:GNAT family N-acetyltransferase [Actinoplanes sp.]